MSLWLTKITQSYLSRPKLRELVRFAFVGITATLLHYLIYILLLKAFPLNAIWWGTVAYGLGYSVAFLGNLWLTAVFTFRTKLNLKRSGGFALSHGINFVNHLLLYNVFRQLGMSEIWTPIPVFVITALINFLLVRFIFTSEYFQSRNA